MVASNFQCHESCLPARGPSVQEPELEEELYRAYFKIRHLLECYAPSAHSDAPRERAETAVRLEECVRECVADLAAEIRERERMQIVDSQRAQMATTKLAALGEMADWLADEVDSLLNIIQARVSDLRQVAEAGPHVESPEVLEAAGGIVRAGDRIISVVLGLQAFARDGRDHPSEKTPPPGRILPGDRSDSA